MAISLYDISVRSYLQTLGGVAGFLEKSKGYLESEGINLTEVCDSRTFPNMLDLRFQVYSVAHHSQGAIEAAKAGVFTPSGPAAGVDYAALQQMIAEARAYLEKVTPDEINALQGREMVFKFGEMKMPFNVEDFILSFSLPNFHFHATTAYNLLRARGAPLGKRDYMGPLRLKTPA